MLLNEELGTEPVWVINNGISHQESVPSLNGSALLQDMLDSIQFITGPAESQWGSLRASMGHPEPWNLTYIGIGNEVTHSAYLPASCHRQSGQVKSMGIPAHKVGHPESWDPTYTGISDEMIHLSTGFDIFIPFDIDGLSLPHETRVQSEQGHEHAIGQSEKVSVEVS